MIYGGLSNLFTLLSCTGLPVSCIPSFPCMDNLTCAAQRRWHATTLGRPSRSATPISGATMVTKKVHEQRNHFLLLVVPLSGSLLLKLFYTDWISFVWKVQVSLVVNVVRKIFTVDSSTETVRGIKFVAVTAYSLLNNNSRFRTKDIGFCHRRVDSFSFW